MAKWKEVGRHVMWVRSGFCAANEEWWEKVHLTASGSITDALPRIRVWNLTLAWTCIIQYHLSLSVEFSIYDSIKVITRVLSILPLVSRSLFTRKTDTVIQSNRENFEECWQMSYRSIIYVYIKLATSFSGEGGMAIQFAIKIP